MAIKESALAAITSIAQTDFVRAVTAAGASRRVTVANLAKAIIESYTGSKLAGSSQSVKSAIDSLNSKTYDTYTPQITGGTGFAVDNVQFAYQATKDFLWIAGRLNITNAGSTAAMLTITYPSGVTARATFIAPIGTASVNKSYSGADLSLRADATDKMYVQAGAGGYSLPLIGTGYLLINALIPR